MRAFYPVQIKGFFVGVLRDICDGIPDAGKVAAKSETRGQTERTIPHKSRNHAKDPTQYHHRARAERVHLRLSVDSYL